MAYINFYRGVRANYTGTDAQQDCIYFATDTQTILMGGLEYGISTDVADDIELITTNGVFSVEFNSPDNLVFKNLEGIEVANVTIPEATTTVAGLMTAEDKTSLDQAVTDIEEINTKIEEVESNIETSISGLQLNYNSEDRLVELQDDEGTVISSIDATDFIKDGMLDSASLETDPTNQPTGTYIHLVFNTDAGKDDIYIDVTSLIDIYTAGNGITVENNIISVKISESSEGFIEVTEDGIVVSGVQDAIDEAVNEAINGDGENNPGIANYTVNGYAISTNPVLNGADIALTGFTDTDLISSTDTVNDAIAKLDNQLIWNEA